jgi:hypothetical protein
MQLAIVKILGTSTSDRSLACLESYLWGSEEVALEALQRIAAHSSSDAATRLEQIRSILTPRLREFADTLLNEKFAMDARAKSGVLTEAGRPVGVDVVQKLVQHGQYASILRLIEKNGAAPDVAGILRTIDESLESSKSQRKLIRRIKAHIH